MSHPIDCHPRLVEAAVWTAVRGGMDEAAYHREREAAYALTEPEERDRAFERIDGAWFSRLGLGEPVQQAVLEQGPILDSLRRILVGWAARDKDQGAELFVAEGAAGAERSVVITIRPETLVARECALPFLRRELTHISDMLDPAFLYEPRLPRQPAGPSHDRWLQDRYRILWDCSVDGRLVGRGRLDASARGARLAEFGRAFAGLGGSTEPCFDRLFGPARPTHNDLIALAIDPGSAFGLGGGIEASPRCGVCSFPTVDLEPEPALLSKTVVAAILEEIPGWGIGKGICRQCADLYRARPMSLAAAGLLPGSAPRIVISPGR